MTWVTAAIGTDPPGVIMVWVNAPQVEIQRPSTVKPKLRSGSNTFANGPISSGW